MNDFDKDLYKEIIKDIPEEAFKFFRENMYFHGFKVLYYENLRDFLQKYFTGNPLVIFSNEDIKENFIFFLENMNEFYEFITAHSMDTGKTNLNFRRGNHPKTGGKYHDLQEEQEIEYLGSTMLDSYNNFIKIYKMKITGVKIKKDTVLQDNNKEVFDIDNLKKVEWKNFTLYFTLESGSEFPIQISTFNDNTCLLLNLLFSDDNEKRTITKPKFDLEHENNWLRENPSKNHDDYDKQPNGGFLHDLISLKKSTSLNSKIKKGIGITDFFIGKTTLIQINEDFKDKIVGNKSY